MEKKTLLLISHSSELTGGGEDNFEIILKYLHDKYNIIGVFPEGVRVETFKRYCSHSITVPNKIFPISKSSLIQYFDFIWKSMGKLYKIFYFINNKKVDLCLLNTSVSFMEIFPLLYFKIPYVIYIREKIFPSYVKKIIFKFINKTARGIVVNSEFTRDDFINTTDRKNVELIYSTVNENYLKTFKINYNELLNNENTFEILNVGSIYNIKNQSILINALTKIKDSNDIRVKIIGKVVDKNYYDSLIKLIYANALNKQVEIVGELNKKDLIPKILNSNCVVISSRQESFSLVLLEALFFEKPIISTNVGVVREVIKHEENGLIYNYDDPVTLAKHILTLKNNSNFYNKFIQESKRTYDKYFSTRISLKRLEEYILKSINKTRNID